jgi:thymine-DNA glycosylase
MENMSANTMARVAAARARQSATRTSRQHGTPSRKRSGSTASDDARKRQRSSKKDRSRNDPYEPKNNLVDSLRPGLLLVFIGLNPGLTTAETGTCKSAIPRAKLMITGHAYAHRSNRFWHLLHESGVTPKKHLPSETHDLPDLYQIGNTNICSRATRDGSGLSKEELARGAVLLEEKVRRYQPEAVCIVGKQIWEALWLARTGKKLKKEGFKWGWQDEENWLGRRAEDGDGTPSWPGARTFVATSTSGLSASMKPHEKLEVWRPLGTWFDERRREAGAEPGIEGGTSS